MRCLVVAALILAVACKKETPPPTYQSLPVVHRDIVVSAQASGSIQPDTTVEVKSKASGEILDLAVETGQSVKRGDLMVRVDPRIPKNSVAQAQADLEVAQARLTNASSQKRRADELFQSQSITEQEHEQALLDYANANAEVIRARVSVDNAKDQLDDTNVRAPINGTIIEKQVERGQGSAGGFGNPDEQILIPLQTARYRVFGSNRIRSFSIQVADNVPIEQGMVDLERVLRRGHKIRPGAENDFTIRNQQDILATQQQATEVFTSLLASIAAVSLLVGGIGIMNIMLVSVTERTREIGIRKALGATRLNIMMQFLIEALTLCLLGGLLGVLLGVGTAVLLAKVMHWNTLISPLAVAVAFAFSAAVGLFFGIYPARRAASLDPIVALRYE